MGDENLFPELKSRHKSIADYEDAVIPEPKTIHVEVKEPFATGFLLALGVIVAGFLVSILVSILFVCILAGCIS